MNQVDFCIFEASEIPEIFPNIAPNCFCSISLGSSPFSVDTDYIYNDSNPKWNCQVTFYTKTRVDIVKIQIKTHLPFNQSKLICSTELPLSKFSSNSPNQWIDLYSHEDGSQICGKLFLNIIITQFNSSNGEILPPKLTSPPRGNNTRFVDYENVFLQFSSRNYLALQPNNTLAPSTPNSFEPTRFQIGVLNQDIILLKCPNKFLLTVHSPKLVLADSNEITERQMFKLIPITSERFNILSISTNLFLSCFLDRELTACDTRNPYSWFSITEVSRPEAYFTPGTMVILRNYQNQIVSLSSDRRRVFLKPHTPKVSNNEHFVISHRDNLSYRFYNVGAGANLSAQVSDDIDPTSLIGTTSSEKFEYFKLKPTLNGPNKFYVSLHVNSQYRLGQDRLICWDEPLNLRSSSGGLFEEISIIPIGRVEWTFSDNYKIYLRNFRNYFIGVVGGVMLNGKCPKAANSAFIMRRTGDFDEYGLFGFNDRYISIHDEKTVKCDAMVIGPNETFRVIKNGDKFMFFSRKWEKFLTVEKDYIIHWDRAKGISQESFVIET